MFKRSVVLAFMLAATPAVAAGYLSGDRLFETVAGKTFIWPDKTLSTYGRSGEYHFEGTIKLDGTWRVQGNKLCVTYSSGTSAVTGTSTAARGCSWRTPRVNASWLRRLFTSRG